PGQLAFMSPLGQVVLEPALRSDGDYGLGVKVRNLTEADDILAMTFTLWGVAARSSHDRQRCSIPNEVAGACVGHDEVGDTGAIPGLMEPHTSSAAAKPFLTVPTSCTGEPVETKIHVDGWANPGPFEADGDPALGDPRWDTASVSTPPLVRCDRLQFSPAVVVEPTTTEASSPSGLHVELKVPQNEEPDGFATAHLKDATVLLPEGMTLNPSSADGLGACSPRDVGLVSPPGQGNAVFDRAPPTCPLNSKIGTARVDTPLLEDPLRGDIYLARQGDNPFGSLLALYVVVEGAGTLVKLAGQVRADPDTGRLSAGFADNPQIPFESFALDFKSGPKAPLVTPGCGLHATEAGLTSWAAPKTEVTATDSFRITRGPAGRPCPMAAADPTLSAGMVNPIAGDPSPFAVSLSRDDGAGLFAALELQLPRGIAARLTGVPYCPEAALAAVHINSGMTELAHPACVASQVGSVTVGAGAGPNPLYLRSGKVYLAGPYKGAPLSLAVVIPAVAGPFDLGTVVVRVGVHVDPRTARITVRSDPLPTILQGIPLNLRDIRVVLDRPGFTRNPTSCRPMSIDAIVYRVGAASVAASTPFQARACRALAFKPRLKLALRGPTHRSAHPALRAVLRTRAGDANVGRVAVTLPETEFFENAHIGAICTRGRYASGACPAGSVYGYAKVWSPLLDEPLRGPVYLRSSNHELPDLVAALDGQIRIDLAGRIDTARGRIRNTFTSIPDVPIGKFVLTMKGGRKGLLVNNTELCRAEPRVAVELDAQNGAISDLGPLVKIDCEGRKRKR
ncbi:MAG TPA: hypothetical protein VEW07_13795, partial [Solirubrobacterales bacterium]|nr:hypothetical protein [Solirubrobacterales bacterium]